MLLRSVRLARRLSTNIDLCDGYVQAGWFVGAKRIF